MRPRARPPAAGEPPGQGCGLLLLCLVGGTQAVGIRSKSLGCRYVDVTHGRTPAGNNAERAFIPQRTDDAVGADKPNPKEVLLLLLMMMMLCKIVTFVLLYSINERIHAAAHTKRQSTRSQCISRMNDLQQAFSPRVGELVLSVEPFGPYGTLQQKRRATRFLLGFVRLPACSCHQEQQGCPQQQRTRPHGCPLLKAASAST